MDNDRTEIRPADEDAYPCLEVIGGPKKGGRYPLRAGKNYLGRAIENDIVLEDSSVSRRHAVVDISPDGLSVTDLGSRNGTKVGGNKIDTETAVAHEARLKVGLYEFRLLTGPAEPFLPSVSTIDDDPKKEEGPPTQAEEEVIRVINEEAESSPSSNVRKNRTRWIVYSGLFVILVASLVIKGPQWFKALKPQERPFSEKADRKGTERHPSPPPKSLSADKPPLPQRLRGVEPVFLDFSSSPIPAQIYFGDRSMGTTPFRISTNLSPGKWYEVKAVFQLPEVGEGLEVKYPFTPPVGASVIPVHFAGRAGVFKIAGLPRDGQLYLEGYFEKDPYRAKPIKFAEIIFGKPFYTPYGRYVVEIRKSRQIAMSQTYLDEVVYRREFVLQENQSSYTVDVDEESLKTFPVQVSSIPPGAKVFVDEKEAGATPFNGTFPVGEHLLTLKYEGYFDFVQAMKMDMNMPYVAEIPLKTSEAGELINRADALIKGNRHSEALPVLVEAYSKKPSARETAQISQKIGVCYLKQKATKEAQDYFLKAMEHDDFKYPARLGIAQLTYEQGDGTKALQLLVEVLASSEDPVVRAEAGGLFQKISPLKSVLYVTSEPAGASVLVNGVEVAQKTPLILHDMGVGAYRIQARKEGFQESEIKLNVGVSEFRPVVIKLRRLDE